MTPTSTAARVDVIPPVIQGGMGVNVSSWQMASAVAGAGGLGVISGVGPDLLLVRMLQDGDPSGDVRRAMAAYPDQVLVGSTLKKFFRPDGRPDGVPYRPFPRLNLGQRLEAVRLAALGAYVQVWLAKEGHHGVVGMNLLEKIQLWTPATLLGAMVAGVDVVLVGAGVPSQLPRLLDSLAVGATVSMAVEVDGAHDEDSYEITIDPRKVLRMDAVTLRRPAFLAIVSSHVLAAYLQKDEVTAADGFVVEGFTAGGHNSPPRRRELDASGQIVFGERDNADLVKMAALGLPFWLAGGYGSPARVNDAMTAGARGVQVGTPFALSRESGLRPDLRAEILQNLRDGSLSVRTDPLASPTGFPFKVLELPGTLSDESIRGSRIRNCDLGYLRIPFRRNDSSVGYRCPAEPVDAYVRKGGDAEDTEGRVCICNGLTASAGFPQVRPDTGEEPPVLTLGADLAAAEELLRHHPDGWSAVDVVTWLQEGIPTD